MINYYQPFLLPFLRTKRYRLPDAIRQTLFLSFEDALWALLTARKVPKGSTVLIPDFYCIDVVDNIKNHGYKVVFYPLDDYFQILPERLELFIKKYRPEVLILFHACGIQSRASRSINKFFRSYPTLVIIEDAVHRLINPETVIIENDNHYIIDSLRKVSPLHGSFLYSTKYSPIIASRPVTAEWQYYVSALGWYTVFRCAFVIGMTTGNFRLVRYSHEHLLKRHDDIIGDSTHGYAGLWVTRLLHTYLDFLKISREKTKQAALYEKQANRFGIKYPSWYALPIHSEDRGQLHVFPIAFRSSHAARIRTEIQIILHTKHLPVWFKYPDSPWSKHRGVLFLPLGFHIRSQDINEIMTTLDTTPTRSIV